MISLDDEVIPDGREKIKQDEKEIGVENMMQ